MGVLSSMEDGREKTGFAEWVEQRTGRKIPDWLRGLTGEWFIITAAIMVLIVLVLFLAGSGNIIWGSVCACAAVVLLALSNFWFRERVSNPALGLGDTARRIADGCYGALAERLHDDELGQLTDILNDMSVKIGEADKAQADFVSSVSHELRTPLTAITGWSETLMYDEAIQGDSRRGLEIISSEAGRLTNMVEELLEFTRIRDGRFTLNLETVDLAALMDDVVFTYSELLRHDDITLSYAPPEKPVDAVTGDPRRLKQVVLNILDNAVKYARGGHSIELALTQKGEYVIMTVRDHGPGIAEEDLPHVKERFYKGRSKERGSGIGLAVCDEIVSRHSGTLTMANADGGGTLATVSLPVHTQ